MSKVAETDATESDIYYLTEDEVAAGVAEVLDHAEITLPELRAQAREGRFQSEKARLAWFTLKGLGQA